MSKMLFAHALCLQEFSIPDSHQGLMSLRFSPLIAKAFLSMLKDSKTRSGLKPRVLDMIQKKVKYKKEESEV